MQGRALIVLAVVLVVVMFSVVAQAAQPVDFTSCRSGTMDILAKTDDVLIRSAAFSGIDQSHHENKLFDNWTHRCMGVGANIGETRIRQGFCKYMDPDGDLMLVQYPVVEGKPFTWRFIGGTGKWKGITGGGDWKFARRGKPIEPGTMQFCIRVTGTFELPK